jgi:hypothetical protein
MGRTVFGCRGKLLMLGSLWTYWCIRDDQAGSGSGDQHSREDSDPRPPQGTNDKAEHSALILTAERLKNSN